MFDGIMTTKLLEIDDLNKLTEEYAITWTEKQHDTSIILPSNYVPSHVLKEQYQKEYISLRNVYISDLGIKVYVKKIKFGELRDENMNYHLQIEAKMLNNYARILIEMLSNDCQNILGGYDNILNDLDIKPELKAILYECIHA